MASDPSLTREQEEVIAILLPLTSRGSSREEALESLRCLAACLPPVENTLVMVGVDDDDVLYTSQACDSIMHETFGELAAAGRLVVRRFPATSPARICHIAASLAREAYEHTTIKCDYFVLLGDDVSIEPKRTWFFEVQRSFREQQARVQALFCSAHDLSAPALVPRDFGVVALPDATFPGFPTFPVLGRAHMSIFGGELWPALFVNQDADPYVFALYRPFGARCFAGGGVTLRNRVGGDESNPTRYERQHVDWKYGVLEQGIEKIERWLSDRTRSTTASSSSASVRSQMLETLDVITPTFRGNLDILVPILSLTFPEYCDCQWIVIVDNPPLAYLRQELESRFRPGHVLVRVNEVNRGASYSRNRGVDESTAKWNLFLDDDVQPDAWIIHRYMEAVRQHGERASGFVGASLFPRPTTMLSAGLTMSYLTYFWGLALLDEGGEYAPWAVTANVLARRGRSRFDAAFAKTGGGEDIAYLRDLIDEFELPLIKAPKATITHPFWDHGYPRIRHFFNWAFSDSMLMEPGQRPQFSFLSWPHAWEITLVLVAAIVVGLVARAQWTFTAVVLLCTVWLTEFALDLFRCLVLEPTLCSGIVGWRRVLCALVACIYKNGNELGHVVGPLSRGYWCMFARRQDWWYGLSPVYITSKRTQEAKNLCAFMTAMGIAIALPTSAAWVVIAAAAVVALVGWVSFRFPLRSDPHTAASPSS